VCKIGEKRKRRALVRGEKEKSRLGTNDLLRVKEAGRDVLSCTMRGQRGGTRAQRKIGDIGGIGREEILGKVKNRSNDLTKA